MRCKPHIKIIQNLLSSISISALIGFGPTSSLAKNKSNGTITVQTRDASTFCLGLCAEAGKTLNLSVGYNQYNEQPVRTVNIPMNRGMKVMVQPDGQVEIDVSDQIAAGLKFPRQQVPYSIQIGSNGSSSFSQLTELFENSEILIGARHQLQGIPRSELRRALESHPRFANQKYHITGFYRGITPLDAVILVPSRYLQTEQNLQTVIKNILESKQFANDIQVSEPFFSYQMAVDQDSRTLRKYDIEQNSYGLVAKVERGHLRAYLPAGGTNYTAPGSSGSIIFLQANSDTENQIQEYNWRIGGIVECGKLSNNQVNKDGRPLIESIRILTSLALKNAEVKEISVDKISLESQIDDPDCIPIDGRGAGG